MKIEVTCSMVQAKGKELLKCKEEFHTQVVALTNVVNQILTIWQGEDAVKYVNIWKDKYFPSLLLIEQTMSEYGKYIQSSAEAYQLLDEIFEIKPIDL